MIAADEDAFICDMAEIYGVFDWRALPLHTVATLAAGLGPGSRSEGARLGLRVPVRDFLTARIADHLALILRFLQGVDVRRLWSDEMIRETAERSGETGAFQTPEEFEAWRSAQFGGGEELA